MYILHFFFGYAHLGAKQASLHFHRATDRGEFMNGLLDLEDDLDDW